MNIRDVKLGTRFELYVNGIEENQMNTIYISQLEEVIDSNHIIISAPIHEGFVIFVSIGSNIEVVFFDGKGLYTFKGIVRDRGRKGNILVLTVEIVSEITKIQRREFFRFEWVANVKFRVVKDKHGSYQKGETQFINALTRDISGGGIGIITNVKQSMGDIVELELELEEGQTISALGQIVRSVIYDNDLTKYDVGIMFYDINPKDRERIIKFIFSKQIKQIQKGMV